MARPKIGYQHFCPAARALEVIGEKWSLLVVRDLLAGPRRFSDLRRTLTAITPKWLSARLRALEGHMRRLEKVGSTRGTSAVPVLVDTQVTRAASRGSS